MEARKRYKIVENSNRHRILVLDGIVDIEKEDGIGFDDFDAIFCNIDNSFCIDTLLRIISPIRSEKCWIKPRFFKTLRDSDMDLHEDVIDGYANSPFDYSVAESIERIYGNIERLHIQHSDELPQLLVMKHLRLCRYAFSRGNFEFTGTIVPRLRKGYSALFMALADNNLVNEREDMFMFIQKMLSLNFISPKSFVERIHVCPECHLSHLLFFECCPHCQSSEIEEVSMLHHFRCANVSPESTYEYDGQLRCPKCRRFLRHIGVDYDRPAEIYSCRHCGETFLHAKMRVFCTSCGNSFKTKDLQPFDVRVFEFTEKGVEKLCSSESEILLSNEQWCGYSNFELFKKQLSWFSYTNIDDRDSAVILRLTFPDLISERAVRRNLLAFLSIRFHHYNFSENKSFLYMAHTCRQAELELMFSEMEHSVGDAIREFRERNGENGLPFRVETFLFSKGEDIDAFIRKISSDSNN